MQDNLIISTAIPRITDTFHSLKDVSWYGSAYLFTTCSFQLVFGKAYAFAPAKTVFVLAISLFEVGSALCGAAPSSVALILGRTIAGIGSAGVFSGALIIMAGVCPLEKRPICKLHLPKPGGSFLHLLTRTRVVFVIYSQCYLELHVRHRLGNWAFDRWAVD